MKNLPAGVIWLVATCVAVVTAAGIVTWMVVRSASADTLQNYAAAIVWVNVALQIVLLLAAGYVAVRLLESDRKRRAAEARTLHQDELALLSGGLAHEIRNHLHALQSRIGLLRRGMNGDASLMSRVEKLDEIVRAMEQIVSDFLTLARPAADELERVDAATAIRSVVDFEALDLDRAQVQLELDLEPEIPMVVDRRKFQRAMLNLIVNARQAMPDGGTLRIQCKRHRGVVQIVVEDTGEGIPPEDLPRIFDSYFTTKAEGTGLGLAIVRRTVEDAGGRIACTSEVGRGTRFTLELPLARHSGRTTPSPQPVAISSEGGIR